MSSRPDLRHMPETVLIVGSGLIGTSLGLVLRRHGVAVYLTDTSPDNLRLAEGRGAGVAGLPANDPDLVVLAVPPAAIPDEMLRWQAQYPASVFTDVSSAQLDVRARARALGCDMSRWVSGHPMAGREVSGPAGADADLFTDKVWVLLDEPETAQAARDGVLDMVRVIGARPTARNAADHDRAMAVISHAPQVVASAMAAVLRNAADADVALAGTGVRDTTRIAGSSPGLWTDILTANAREVARVVDDVLAELADARAALHSLAGCAGDAQERQDAQLAITRLLERGNAGRSRFS